MSRGARGSATIGPPLEGPTLVATAWRAARPPLLEVYPRPSPLLTTEAIFSRMAAPDLGTGQPG